MRAVEYVGSGGRDVIRHTQRPIPEPAAHEVRIRVDTAGVNRPDIVQRLGLYPPPRGASDIPGLEVAGSIDAVGPGVSTLALGDKVCALLTGGGYAEFAVAHEGCVLPHPASLCVQEAAALPESCFTVWYNLFDRGGLRQGQTLLVHGGSSGIGSMAIQMAHSFGITVLATAGDVEKCKFSETMGAAVSVNYHEQDFVSIVKQSTDGRGVDMVLDIVGGPYAQRNLDALAEDGTLAIIGLLGGHKAEISLNRIMLKRLHVTGSTLRGQGAALKTRLRQAIAERVLPLVEARRVVPHVHRVFPLEDVADAQKLMEVGGHMGKIVLQVAEPA